MAQSLSARRVTSIKWIMDVQKWIFGRLKVLGREVSQRTYYWSLGGAVACCATANTAQLLRGWSARFTPPFSTPIRNIPNGRAATLHPPYNNPINNPITRGPIWRISTALHMHAAKKKLVSAREFKNRNTIPIFSTDRDARLTRSTEQVPWTVTLRSADD